MLGKRRHFIDLLRRIETLNDSGEEVVSWETEVADIPAQIEIQTSTEGTRGNETESLKSYMFTIHHPGDVFSVTTDKRVEWREQGKTFDIETVETDYTTRRTLEIVGTVRVA